MLVVMIGCCVKVSLIIKEKIVYVFIKEYPSLK